MNRVHNFPRKRTHVLPPLPDSQSSSLLRPVDSLQPPDLLLLENRLGSPAPRPSDPREFDSFCNGNKEKPMIKISGPHRKENEKHNLMKFDLLPDSIFSKTNSSLYQKENAFKVSGLEGRGVKENLSNNFSKKVVGKLAATVNNNDPFQTVTPLEEHKSLEGSEPKFFQIPSRYTLLKPIGEGWCDN